MYRAKHPRRKRRLPAPASGIGRQVGRPNVKSLLSILSIGSVVGSILSIGSAGSVMSIGSAGSILSIGSAGSILSIGSAGSILCIGSTGSILRVGRDKDEADES